MAPASAQQSAALTFNLFGRPRLMVNRREISFQRRQPLAILAVLALGERPFSRDELTYLLWPDAAQEVARQRLRRSLSELRHAVGPQAAALLLGSDASSRLALGFNHSICQVDAQAFLRLAHYADASPDPDGLRAAEQAAQIGNAPLLVGLELNGTPEFEHWLREQREHFDRLRVDVLRRMAQGYAALRDYPRAMAAVQQALTLDQWSVRNDFSAALTYG